MVTAALIKIHSTDYKHATLMELLTTGETRAQTRGALYPRLLRQWGHHFQI